MQLNNARTIPLLPRRVAVSVLVAVAVATASTKDWNAQSLQGKRASKDGPELTRGHPTLAVGEHRRLLETDSGLQARVAEGTRREARRGRFV